MSLLKTKYALMIFTSAAFLFSLCAFGAEGDSNQPGQHAGVQQNVEPESKPESKADNQALAEPQPQQSSQSTAGNTARIARQATEVAPELLKGLEQVRLAPQTLESIERAFKERGSISRQEIPSVVAEIRQKDPSLSEGQAQQLRRVIDSRVANLPPDKVGPQISAAARKLLDQGSAKGGFSGGGEGSPVPLGKDGKPTLDSDFFGKKDEKSESGDKSSGKRSDVLDAIQLLLAAKGKDDKDDKDDDKGKRDNADRGGQPQPPPPPPGGDRRDEDEEKKEDPFADLAKSLKNDRRTPPPVTNSSSSDSDKKKDKDEDSSDKESKSSKKEKSEGDDELAKLEEELKAKELEKQKEKEKEQDTTLQPPPEDLLAAAKAQALQIPPNKIPLPSLPPPPSAGAAALPGGDPAGMGGVGGGGFAGGGGVSGGGGGGSGGSSFQGDPFGSVGFEPGGAPPAGFNYSRLAEFGSSNGGSESASMPGDGYGGSDYSNVKRAFAMADEIKTYPSDETGSNIVERFLGSFEHVVCGSPEAERVGVCEKAFPKRATSEQPI